MNNKIPFCTHQKSTQSLKQPQFQGQLLNLVKINSQKDDCQQSFSQSSQEDRKSNINSENCFKLRVNDPRLQEWTPQDENQLKLLHNQKGNKWVQIAEQLNKTDNAVKNHYHSKLRKGLRKINRCIDEHLENQLKCLKSNTLSKIIQAAQDLYMATDRQPSPQSHLAYSLKNAILVLADLSQQLQFSQQQIEEIKKITGEINYFNKIYKKKCKTISIGKSNCNKYKGKQIMSLLQENNQQEQYQASKKLYRKIQAKREEKALKNRELKQSSDQQCSSFKKIQQTDESHKIFPTSNSQNQHFKHFQTYLMVSQPILNIPQLYIPFYSQNSPNSFSAKLPTIPSYSQQIFQIPEPMSWKSSQNHSVCEYNNILPATNCFYSWPQTPFLNGSF